MKFWFLFILTVPTFAQSQKMDFVTWSQPTCRTEFKAPASIKFIKCDSIVLDGERIKIIALNGLFFAASFYDDGNYIVSEVYFDNDTGDRVLLDPGKWAIIHFKSKED